MHIRVAEFNLGNGAVFSQVGFVHCVVQIFEPADHCSYLLMLIQQRNGRALPRAQCAVLLAELAPGWPGWRALNAVPPDCAVPLAVAAFSLDGVVVPTESIILAIGPSKCLSTGYQPRIRSARDRFRFLRFRL